MNADIYDDFALERMTKEQFGFSTNVNKVIARQIPVGPTTHATLFLTDKKQLLVYIQGQSKLLLSDIKRITSRMGLKAELFFPPKGQIDYFDTIGREKFRAVFPGRSDVSDHDILFYRTLAPYNPALVLIQEIKNGEIYQYDSTARTNWRVATKFAYRRIKTS